MREIVVSGLIFVGLVAASLGSLVLYSKLPPHHRQDDTQSVVRAIANIFVVMTSLVLGLMLNSSKGTFESVDHNVHMISTDIILLDRWLRLYGPDADEARQRLLVYTEQTASRMRNSTPLVVDRTRESLIDAVGHGLRAMKPADAEHVARWSDAIQQFHKIVELHWILVEQSEGMLPWPIISLMVAWLLLIFASFGYRAPRNAVVVASFIMSAALIAGAIYLIIDMNVPFRGPIQVSPAPLQRAIVEMTR
jgi:hypothetical protein